VNFNINRPLNWMHIDGDALELDTSELPPNVIRVKWNGSEGFIDYSNLILSQRITDASPYQVYLDRWTTAKLTATPSPILQEAQAIKIGLVNMLYDIKRQADYAYAVAADASAVWEANDGAMANMAVAVIPGILNSIIQLAGETGGGTGSLVDQLNANYNTWHSQLNANYSTWYSQLNANYSTWDSQLNANYSTWSSQINAAYGTWKGQIDNLANEVNARIGSFNANIEAAGDALANGINANIVDQGNGTVSEVNSRIVTHLNTAVLGYSGDTINTLSNKLQSTDINAPAGPPLYAAAPGLGGNLATLTSLDVSFSYIGYECTDVGGVTYPVISSASISSLTISTLSVSSLSVPALSVSVPPLSSLGLSISWTPVGEADPVTLSAAEVAGIMSGVANRRTSLLQTKQNKTTAINALTNIEDVIAYDATAGWP
jgi:hypothetical protein